MTAEQVNEIQSVQEALEYILACDERKYSKIVDGACGVAISTTDEDGLYEIIATNGKRFYAHMVDYRFALKYNRLMAKTTTTAEFLADELIF